MTIIKRNIARLCRQKMFHASLASARNRSIGLTCLLVGLCTLPPQSCTSQVVEAPAKSTARSDKQSPFSIGDSIQATGRVSVFKTPSGLRKQNSKEKNQLVDPDSKVNPTKKTNPIKGDQVKGRLGKIIGGPKTVTLKNSSVTSQWWDIDWESGADGWTIQSKLQPVKVDLKHGDLQVAAMLRDRPMMASYTNADGEVVKVSSDDEIWKWAARRFGTTVNTQKTFWDGADLADKSDTYAAEHTIPRPDQRGEIRLRSSVKRGRRTVELPFSEMWSSAFFELINVTSSGGFMELYEQSLTGELSRHQFVENNQRLEYEACIALQEVFHKQFAPWAKKHGYAPSRQVLRQGFMLDVPDTYEAWIKRYPGGGYDYFFNYFDESIAPYLKSIGRYEPAKHDPPKTDK